MAVGPSTCAGRARRTRRLMIRLPKRLVDRTRLDAFLRGGDLAEVIELGEHLILDIYDDCDPPEYDDWDDGSGWLGALAPLRAELISGDWRLPYLIWLAAVDNGSLRDEEREPIPGIGPLTGGLEAFAGFFRIDSDLVQTAAEAAANAAGQALSSEAIRAAVAAIPAAEKAALLHRLAEDDPHVAVEVRNRVREAVPPAAGGMQAGLRTVSALRVRAAAIREGREAAEVERREAERVRRERETEEARRARLDVLRLRGKDVWREIESEIEKRNANGLRPCDRLACRPAGIGRGGRCDNDLLRSPERASVTARTQDTVHRTIGRVGSNRLTPNLAGGVKDRPANPLGPSPNREVLAGLVERVTFHNPDNGFCVLRNKGPRASRSRDGRRPRRHGLGG